VSGGPSMIAFHMKKSDCVFGSAVQRAIGSLHSFAYSDVKRLIALSLDEAIHTGLQTIRSSSRYSKNSTSYCSRPRPFWHGAHMPRAAARARALASKKVKMKWWRHWRGCIGGKENNRLAVSNKCADFGGGQPRIRHLVVRLQYYISVVFQFS
jgi:hypothetical protein